MAAWMVRAGRTGERESWALENQVSGGGFREVGDLISCQTRDEILDVVRLRLLQADRPLSMQLVKFGGGQKKPATSAMACRVLLVVSRINLFYQCASLLWSLRPHPPRKVRNDQNYNH